ncbi:GFA family protein [Sphingopyxis sp. 22461]|uniref:GFA family protein n=1 Tax=Sphingopyxis sp. 22461 TaxID=3453923 RepID=UPI003F87B75E
MTRGEPGMTRTASCPCGAVRLELSGEPIMAATCYCHSCQEAGRSFAALPGAPGVVGTDGGTPYVLMRKDRLQWLSGSDQLDEHRLKPDSPTRRFVARCCNAPIALEFTKGHWLSVYSGRIAEAERPAAEMRTIVGDRPDGVELPDDIPNYRTPTGKFMWRLLKAWAAMGFRAPPIEATKGYAG